MIESTIREQIAFGISPKDVAAYHNMTVDELISKYGNVVRTAAIDRDVEVARTFYNICVGASTEGNATACAAWLKSRCQWDKLLERSELPDDDNTFKRITIKTLSAEDKVNDSE